MLINHQKLFGGNTNPAHPKHIGSMNLTCNVAKVVKGVYETAKRLCEPHSLVDLEVEEFNAKTPDKYIQVVHMLSRVLHASQELSENNRTA